MNQSSQFKPIHAIGVALGAAMVAVFLWSTLGVSAFNGPTANPSSGNGAISTDASNNVYIGGNLNVTGTITGSGLGGSTINAENVSSGEFGSSTEGGDYSFPASISVAGLYTSAVGDELQLDNGSNDFSAIELDYNNSANGYGNFDFYNNTLGYEWSFGAAAPGYTDDPNITNSFWITNDPLQGSGPAGYPLVVNGTTSYVGIQEPLPVNMMDVGGTGDFRGALAVGTTTTSTVMLNVNGSSSAAAYCISGANCITAWPSAGSNPTINGTQSSTFHVNASGNITSTLSGASTTFSITGVIPAANGGTNTTTALTALAFASVPLSAANGGTATTTALGTDAFLSTAIPANYISTFNGGSGAQAYNLYGGLGITVTNGTASTTLTVNQAAALSFSALGNTTSTANITAASMSITSATSTASTMGGSALTTGSCNTATVTITGATSSTGSVFVMPQKNPGSGVTWQGYVSAANTVTIVECAATATTPTATKFNAIYIY
jgi:hypothetical protein